MNSSKNIVNNDDKNFQCEICEKFYTTKHCLQNHIDKCHHEKNIPKKLYKCHIMISVIKNYIKNFKIHI